MHLYGQKQRENSRHHTIQPEEFLFSKNENIFPKRFFFLFVFQFSGKNSHALKTNALNLYLKMTSAVE